MRVSESRSKSSANCRLFFAAATIWLAGCGPVSEVEKSARQEAEAVSHELAKLLGKDEAKWSSVIFGERLRIEIGSGSVAVVRPSEGAGADTDTFSATLRALQSVGSTSRVLSADVPSLNGKPAQFYELLKTAYLREISTKTTQTGSETTLKPGEVSSGFALSYTARITAPDEVLVRLAASLRDRPNFAVFGTSQAQIQLPVYADRGVQATQRLRRGDPRLANAILDRLVHAAYRIELTGPSLRAEHATRNPGP